MALLIQSSFGKGEVAPGVYGRVDIQAYASSLRTARNVLIRTTGGAMSRPGQTFIGPVKDHSYAPRLIPFQFNTADDYEIEVGDKYMRFIRNDAHVTETPLSVLGITQANPGVVNVTAHGFATGDEVYFNAAGGMTQIYEQRYKVTVVDANHFSLNNQVTNAAINTTSFAAYTSGGTVARIYTLVTPYAIADVPFLTYTQTANVMTLTHTGYTPYELARISDANWSLVAPTYAPVTPAPTGAAATTSTTGTVSHSYVVTALAVTTLEESLPSNVATIATSVASGYNDTITWTAVTPIPAKYSVYMYQNGIYGWLGDATGTSFINNNQAPTLTITPPQASNPFSGSGNYPAAASFFSQRRVMGGALHSPDTSNYSRTGSPENYSASLNPVASDAITAKLNSQQVNVIRHYIPFGQDLLIFTSGAEWQINSGNNGAFSATTMVQNPQSAWGCSALTRPYVVGKQILYVQDNGAQVRNLGFSWQVNGYTGKDVSLMANHLFAQFGIVDWTLARTPDPVFYCIRSDGILCTMTYDNEQDVIAWSHWDSAGWYESVGSLPHPATEIDEVVYFVMRRFINGNTVRYIERTHSRRFNDVRDCFFVDAGLSYDNPVAITGITYANPCKVTAPSHGLTTGDYVDIFDIEWVGAYDSNWNLVAPDQLNTHRYQVTVVDANNITIPIDSTNFSLFVQGGTLRKCGTTIADLNHLEGQGVAVLADGNVVPGMTVTNGQIILPRMASRVHVGLPFVADIETLDIEPPGRGTAQGLLKSIPRVIVRFENSRGLLVGPDSDHLNEMKQRADENWGDPTMLLTGDEEIGLEPHWNSNGRIFLRQKDPLPMTILAVMPDAAIGD